MFRIKLFFLLTFLFVFNAAAKDLNLKAYTVEQGLVQSQVYTILQDLDGYLWVGTGDGLSRFDGKDFITYRRQNGLGGNIVSSGLRDKNGNLWFGHYSGKVTKYDWKNKSIKAITLLDSGAFYIRKIAQDSKGCLWVGTNTKGIFLYLNDKWMRFTRKDGLKSNAIQDMASLDDGSVLIAFDKGMLKCSFDTLKKTLIINRIPELNFLDKELINDLDVNQDNGDIWIATETQGLVKLTSNKQNGQYNIQVYGKKLGLPVLSVKKIGIDKKQQIWIAVHEKGIIVADLNKSSIKLKINKWFREEFDLQKTPINIFMPDREGNMWIGTDGGGLLQYRNLDVQIYSYDINFSNKSVWSIYVSRKNTIWFGMEGGIAYARRSNIGLGKVKYLANLNIGEKGKKQITRIIEDRNGDLYFISWGNGIFKLNTKSNTSQKYIPYKGFPQDKVTSFIIDKNTFWFVTDGKGIIRYNYKTGAVKKYDFSDKNPELNRTYELFKDSKGNIWFGSYTAGALKYDGKQFHILNKQNGFPLESAISFTEDAAGNIWFVSYDGELVRYDGKHFKDFSFARGLEGHPVYSVISDNSTIWVGTTSGIARYEAQDTSFSSYNIKFGFPIYETNQGATFRDSEGNIWFGTIKDVIQIEAEKKEIPRGHIPLYINNVQLFFKNIPFHDGQKYNYNKNFLTFHYQAVSLTNPLRIKYSYKLEGYDLNWSPPFSEKRATYSNLPPGSYTFKVKACDSYGVWSDKAAAYHFEILAPFWRTWPFYLLIIMFTAFMIFFLHKRRVIKLEEYNRELEEEVQKRVSEVSNEKEKVEYALKALRESEKKFRVFTETTSSSIFIIKNGRIHYINPAGEKILGYNKSELTRLSVLNLIHHDFVKEVRDYLVSGLKLQKLYKAELKIVAKSGNEKWIDVIVKPIMFDNEEVFLGTAVDVSERKVAEERLLEEKERLAVTLSSITDAVVTTDIQGIIVLMNRVAEKISGFSSQEAIGKNINDIFNLEDEQSHKSIENLFNESLKRTHNKSIEEEAVLINQNKQKIYIEYTSSVIRDSKSEISGMVFVFRDITERKRMFDELLKTKKLESLGVLAGGIAHDFNNILTAVIGNLSLAKMKLDSDKEAFKWIDLSEKSSMRARDLTQQLLTFSKGGAPIKKNAPIDKLIEDTTAFILSGSNVNCKLHFAENLPHVNMDQGQISQVIQNLIINAQNAMPNGGTIEIDVVPELLSKSSKLPLKEGSYIKISIKDEGAGIPEEHIDKVFDPFYTTNKSGSGLGLSTAYSIIKNHNGSISVESVVRQGTTFTIYLPAAPVTRKSKKAEDTGIVHGKGRILVMDDEELVLDTAAALFDFIGFDVVKAENGEEAIRIYREEMNKAPFAAVIMDLTIPGGMGGKEAVKDILKYDPDAVVIVSSGYSSDPVMAEFEQYGFKGRIKKPYNLEELSALLKSLNLV